MVSVTQQLEVRLMDERGRLEGLIRRLLGQFERSQLAQFRVHQRQQLLGGPGIARLDGVEDDGDVAHGSSAFPAAAISLGVAARQNFMMPLREKAQSELPSGAKPTSSTPSSLPKAGLTSKGMVQTSCIIRRFQSLIVPSMLQLASVPPSGENVVPNISCPCPKRRWRIAPV